VLEAPGVMPAVETLPPKRPLSPYLFFSQQKRKELKEEHPDWISAQIMK
jgi:hypothetical protein